MRHSDRFARKAMGLTLGASLLLVLAGCVTEAFKSEFVGINSAYAQILNQQLLLNLARLDNGHPPQFLAVGAINSRYTFTAGGSGGLSQQHAPTTTEATTSSFVGTLFEVTGRVVTTVSSFFLGTSGNLTATAQSQPEFQWIPLNNEGITHQILDALDPGVFYTLYQQGYPIDQLLRVTVERIEIDVPPRALVLTNSPSRSSRIQTGQEWESYRRFLRACAMLRELQRQGLLQVETKDEYEPLSEAVFDHPETDSPKHKGDSSGDPTEKNGDAAAHVGRTSVESPDKPPGSGAQATPGGIKGLPTGAATPAPAKTPAPVAPNTPTPAPKPKTPTPTPKKTSSSNGNAPAGAPMIAAWEGETDFKPTPDEILTAKKEGYVYRKMTGGYQLCIKSQVPTFKVRRGDVSRARQILLADERIIRQPEDRQAVDTLLEVMVFGFTVQGKVKATSSMTHLILRSFSRSLEATASEQNLFDELMETDFRKQVPLSESWPILRTRWKGGQQLERPLIKLSYMGKTYQITDSVAPKGKLEIEEAYARTWNRDVYRLLMALNSQVTVDIAKFQRSVLELQQ